MSAGRPTKYKDEYCDLVVELMKDGASKAEVCLELECCFQTFLNWQEEHAEFLEAVKKGLHLSKGKWEKMGRLAAFGNVEGFNSTAWIFNMKNRFGRMDEFGEKWGDKQEIETKDTTNDVSEEELNARILELMSKLDDSKE